MPASLSTELRRQLESITQDARDAATAACRAALENLAVHEPDYRPHMSIDQRKLRNRLRARGRALGDSTDPHTNRMGTKHLEEEAAYEHWHRLLFTRFLAENHLLHTDEENGSVPVTLDECEELATELGAKDGFDLACRFASQTLPGIFRKDDPILELPIASNDRVKLRGLLDSIPSDVFTADDSLGWTYQFWQTQRKDEVNASGKKIGADEISPVTQLFTEDYMVEFLLHNTLGAWWAGKQGPITASSEAEARAKVALHLRDGLRVDWTYLRFVQDEANEKWNPASGTFDGWPKQAAKITYLDPCMGSGHFPVFALPIIARMRMEEEGLSAADAIFATLRDNIHGLEIDPRCCQIGAFNLALTAWKLGGYQKLPILHVACCGIAPQAKLSDWIELAGDNDRMRRGMERLYKLFEQAPVLGSLINPRIGGGDLVEAEFSELQPLVEAALQAEAKDDAEREMKITANGIARAAEFLSSGFTLVATNVPYLGRGKQDKLLNDYCDHFHSDSKADLATCFIERCLNFCDRKSSAALVAPQAWWFAVTYKNFRNKFLLGNQINQIVTLGEEAWQSFGDRGPVAALTIVDRNPPSKTHTMSALDALPCRSIDEKICELLKGLIRIIPQAGQHSNPDHRITVDEPVSGPLLQKYATAYVGLQNGDLPRYVLQFWELSHFDKNWEFFQMAANKTAYYLGRNAIIRWEGGNGSLSQSDSARVQGLEAWNNEGVLITRMRKLSATIYSGHPFDQSGAALIPKDPKHLVAIWCFLSSGKYDTEVRRLDKKVNVTPATLVKVPFNLEHWQTLAAEKYPHGLPKPCSSDLTQWLFEGQPSMTDQPLHVAVARLLNYNWPRQTGSNFPDCPALGPDDLESHADADGIVCLAPIHGEQTAASRLRSLLSTALGNYNERDLIRKAGPKGSKSTNLEDWLRDEFFTQHCTIFNKRPFIWHIWDGLKDGFHALINYHKLDHAKLKTLAYTYLGDWIREQKAAAEADEPGAAERLGAAKHLQSKLIAILEGDAPLDIFVRWKTLHEQPIGWNPDLNDGVRQNIRPFLFAGDVGLKGAGLFRTKPGIVFKDKPDRGTEPDRDKSDYPWFWCQESPGTDPIGGKSFVGKRWNNVHFTNERKKAAQEAHK